MINFFRYNGVSSKDMGLYITKYDVYSVPAKRSVVETIPGRDGDLIIENGTYANKKIVYTVAFSTFLSEGKVERNITKRIKEWLYSTFGYCDLEDSYNPAYYREAVIYEELAIEELITGAVDELKITFYCKPYMYAKKYPTFESRGGTFEIYNPYKYSALPSIKVTSTGCPIPPVLKINNEIFSTNPSGGQTMIIDSEKRTIVEITTVGTEGLSTHMIHSKGKFPQLSPYRNIIQWETHGSERLEIQTRWRCL